MRSTLALPDPFPDFAKFLSVALFYSMASLFYPIQPLVFEIWGNKILKNAPGLSPIVENRRFRSLSGVTPDICALVWHLIGHNIPCGAQPHHLLWAFMFFKCYASEHNNRLLSGADEKTFRKWSWAFISLLANQQIVRLGHFSRFNFSVANNTI